MCDEYPSLMARIPFWESSPWMIWLPFSVMKCLSWARPVSQELAGETHCNCKWWSAVAAGTEPRDFFGRTKRIKARCKMNKTSTAENRVNQIVHIPANGIKLEGALVIPREARGVV